MVPDLAVLITPFTSSIFCSHGAKFVSVMNEKNNSRGWCSIQLQFSAQNAIEYSFSTSEGWNASTLAEKVTLLSYTSQNIIFVFFFTIQLNLEALNLRFKKKKGEEKGRKRKEKERKKKNCHSIDYNITYTVMITTGNLQFTFSRTGLKTKQHYKNSTHCEWHLRHCISTITKANSQGGTEILKIKVFTLSYNSSSMR